MRFLIFFFLVIAGAAFTQVQAQNGFKLPDITKIDSGRVQKRKVSPQDTSRKVRIITIAGKDTVLGEFFDSIEVATKLRQAIWEENNRSANNTYLLFQQISRDKGQTEYGKIYRRVTGEDYTNYTWSVFKTQYLGGWVVYGQGTTQHQMVVDETANATRTQGTPAHKGKFVILSDNRVQLRNYFGANTTTTFNFVTRQEYESGGQKITQNVFMSTDGRYFLAK